MSCATAVAKHRGIDRCAQCRSIDKVFCLIIGAHLATDKAERQQGIRAFTAESKVVHEAPPLENVVDAIDGILRIHHWRARAHVVVQVGVVADGQQRVEVVNECGRGRWISSKYLLRCRELAEHDNAYRSPCPTQQKRAVLHH